MCYDVIIPTTKGNQMAISTSAPKTTSPDWMNVECECNLLWCPECDPDSYVDQMREDAGCWDDAFELEPPF
jgi:hypothetical protein